MDLSELISSLKKSFCGYPNIDFIIKKLEEMDSLVEMDSVKETFVGIMLLILTMGKHGCKPPFKKKHIVLSGPPGVGKTTMSILIAEILSALKILDKDSQVMFQKEYSVDELLDLEIEKEEYVEEKKDIAYVMNEVQDKMYDILRLIDSQHGKDAIGTIPEHIKTIYSKSSDSADLCQEIINKYSSLFLQIDEDFFESSSSEDDEPSIKEEKGKPYVVLGRQDFVGTHQGHTTSKTEKVLQANKGKVIIIEEAYLLSTDPKDSYGMEALTVINRYMDEQSDDYIFILNGYEDILDRTIFKVQPGLRRRIQWTFNVEEYTPEGLYKIFLHQLERFSKPVWKIDENESDKYLKFFKQNKDKFPHFGGDTERLILNIQLEYARDSFDKVIEDRENITIKFNIFEEGFKAYLLNLPKEDPFDKPPPGMFI